MKDKEELINEIRELKRRSKTVILAHNYQRDEVQEIADYTGDSLGLSRTATEMDTDTIIFCGVYFMAETAYILNPHKKILIPEPRAGCPLADMITIDQLLKLKSEHPKVPVVCYVNSTAEIKAESDICCTSSNAVSVVNSLDEGEIIFIPDKNLGSYVESKTSKKMILWPGYCPTHQDITADQIRALKKEYPDAVFIAHPECETDVLDLADEITSTSGMYKFAKKTSSNTIIIGSEIGMRYRLEKENPDKLILFPSKGTICPNMKLTTLEKVYRSLNEEVYEVSIDEGIRARAESAVRKMINVS